MASKMKVRTDDTVMVVAGKDKGKTGRVIRAEPKRGRVFVEGLNMVKRHSRAQSIKESQKGGQVGGIIEQEGPIDISNVMVLDPEDNKPTRVGYRIDDDGERVRYAKRTGNPLK